MPVILRLLPDGVALTATRGEAVIDLIDEHPTLSIPVSCRSAHCGSCLVRVRAGAIALAPPSDWERETVERLYQDGDARLACALVISADTGEVELERLPPS